MEDALEPEKPELRHLNLRMIHDLIDAEIFKFISDQDKVESAMSKTPDGYIYEIVYKGSKIQHLQ